MTKKDKKALKRRADAATRLDNFDDIGEFADLEQLVDEKRDDGRLGASSASLLSAGNSKALARAMQELGGAGKKSKLEMMAEQMGEDDDDMGRENGRKRRRAPALNSVEDDDGPNVFDEFVSKKKEFLAKKKEHYTAEPRFGGFEETVDDGRKRAASYEIIKNRGLTPHRKKENRNARVKKRVKYEKAVVARKGQVRDVVQGAASSYGGEGTGIKAQVARSRKL
jgi:U3 small nucleolar RNA-associated protein 3